MNFTGILEEGESRSREKREAVMMVSWMVHHHPAAVAFGQILDFQTHSVSSLLPPEMGGSSTAKDTTPSRILASRRERKKPCSFAAKFCLFRQKYVFGKEVAAMNCF